MSKDKREIIFDNMRRLDGSLSANFEKRVAELGEIAALLCDEAGEDEIFFRDSGFIESYEKITGRLREDAEEICRKGASPVNREKLRSLYGALSVQERVFICRRFTDLLGISGIESTGTFFDESNTVENEKVSYMKSSYADTAYRLFTDGMKNPTVMYGHDFSDVCENVYYGKCEYCILPIENSNDGRLGGFRRLIMKYGLKTTAVCRVGTSDGGSTVFALMKMFMNVPDGDGERFFSFSVRTSDSLTSVINAADACGMKPVKIVSESENEFDITLKINDAGICGFISFLFLEYPDFVPTGIFREVE